MDWKDYIAAKKAQWVGRVVTWNGRQYKVVDVDSNASLMLDLPSRFNPTTAVSETDVTPVQEKSPELVKLIRDLYAPGMRIEIDCSAGFCRPGDRGTVDHVDDRGHIHVNWDSGKPGTIISGLNHFHRLGPYAKEIR